jgi:hypothetical protein
MIYAKRVSPNLSHWVIGVFHNISRMEPSFFHQGFEGLYKSTLLVLFSLHDFLRSLTSKIYMFKCSGGGGVVK